MADLAFRVVCVLASKAALVSRLAYVLALNVMFRLHWVRLGQVRLELLKIEYHFISLCFFYILHTFGLQMEASKS